MSALADLREARDLARAELQRAIADARVELRRLDSPKWREIMAALAGNAHELDLLHRREVSLIGSGTEPPTPEATSA